MKKGLNEQPKNTAQNHLLVTERQKTCLKGPASKPNL